MVSGVARATVDFCHINDLRLWSRNYRESDVGTIVQSIKQFGFNNALRVWRDNTVIAGNHSLKALQALKASGWQPSGGGITADWQIRIIDVSHLSESNATGFAIADNRTSELADNNLDQLTTLLQELANEDAALMQATGYSGDDLDNLLWQLGGGMDYDAAWEGMPEFEQDDIKVFHSIKLNFKTDEDMQAFAELVDQNVTDKTTFIYYPRQFNEPYKDVIDES